MKTELVRIGNSRGIRIPKPLIEQCRLGDKVELRVEDERLVISRERKPREGWDEAFRAVAPETKDSLLLSGLPENRFDRDEWTW